MANVDHIAIAASGVFVIDAKFYRDKRIEIVNKGRWPRKETQLRVASRNRTTLVEKLAKQIGTVEPVVHKLGVNVTGVLCFIQSDFRQLPDGSEIRGVKVVSPVALEAILRRPGPLTPAQMHAVGDRLRDSLRPA